jgi:hypothetical protein
MLKMLSGSFPIFVLSNHTTCCQTQTGATVHLKYCLPIDGLSIVNTRIADCSMGDIYMNMN